jgi:hypothetical protein
MNRQVISVTLGSTEAGLRQLTESYEYFRRIYKEKEEKQRQAWYRLEDTYRDREESEAKHEP